MEQLIAVLLGTFSPQIISFLNLNVPKKNIRYIIAFVVCIIIGFISTLYGKEFSWESLLANVTLAFTASQTVYQTYFKNKLGKMGMKN